MSLLDVILPHIFKHKQIRIDVKTLDHPSQTLAFWQENPESELPSVVCFTLEQEKILLKFLLLRHLDLMETSLCVLSETPVMVAGRSSRGS